MPEPAVPRIREVFPYLCVRSAEAAIAFYSKVFGAEEVTRITGPDGRIIHAELRFGPTIVMLADEQPEWGVLSPTTFGGSGTTMHLHVDDVDSLTRAAVAAGATLLREPADQGHGERQSRFRDPFGHDWLLGCDIAPTS